MMPLFAYVKLYFFQALKYFPNIRDWIKKARNKASHAFINGVFDRYMYFLVARL